MNDMNKIKRVWAHSMAARVWNLRAKEFVMLNSMSDLMAAVRACVTAAHVKSQNKCDDRGRLDETSLSVVFTENGFLKRLVSLWEFGNGLAVHPARRPVQDKGSPPGDSVDPGVT